MDSHALIDPCSWIFPLRTYNIQPFLLPGCCLYNRCNVPCGTRWLRRNGIRYLCIDMWPYLTTSWLLEFIEFLLIVCNLDSRVNTKIYKQYAIQPNILLVTWWSYDTRLWSIKGMMSAGVCKIYDYSPCVFSPFNNVCWSNIVLYIYIYIYIVRK